METKLMIEYCFIKNVFLVSYIEGKNLANTTFSVIRDIVNKSRISYDRSQGGGGSIIQSPRGVGGLKFLSQTNYLFQPGSAAR